MSLLLRDETAQANILCIDDTGAVGLGSWAAAGTAFQIDGTKLFGTDGYFGAGTVTAGALLTVSASTTIPANGSVDVTASFSGLPAVSSGATYSVPKANTVRLYNNTGVTLNTGYSIW